MSNSKTVIKIEYNAELKINVHHCYEKKTQIFSVATPGTELYDISTNKA